MTTTRDFELTAFIILRLPTSVRFVDKCLVAGAGGCAYLDLNGAPVIEVKRRDYPDGQEDMFNTFLHELAHHKLGHLSGAQRQPQTAPGAIAWAEATDRPDYPSHESEVEHQVNAWRKITDRYYSHAAKLQALCTDALAPMIRAAIDKR